jgi:uncharacterized protein
MLKIVIVLVAALVLYMFFFKGKKGAVDKGVVMVECSQCGTFISENEASVKSGKCLCPECIGRKR